MLKNILFALLLFLSGVLMAQEDKKAFSNYQYSYAGVGLAYNDNSEELGLQIRAQSDFTNSRFSSSIYLTIYGEQNFIAGATNSQGGTTNVWAVSRAYEFMVDVHYNLVHKSFKFYPLVGVGVLYETRNAEDEDDDDLLIIDDSDTGFAFNFGLGLQYNLFHFLTVFAEPNATIYMGDNFFGDGFSAFQAGVMYSF